MEKNTGLYLTAVVGVVAIVALAMMVMNNDGRQLASFDTDLAGQAWGGNEPAIYAGSGACESSSDCSTYTDCNGQTKRMTCSGGACLKSVCHKIATPAKPKTDEPKKKTAGYGYYSK